MAAVMAGYAPGTPVTFIFRIPANPECAVDFEVISQVKVFPDTEEEPVFQVEVAISLLI